MPGQACVNHPQEITYVRCGRCDAPICVRCMVDTPVGKKCRACAKNRSHLTESAPHEVALGFLAALAVAIPAGWLMHMIPFLFVGAVVYGWVVAEVMLRAGRRRRSLAMQVAAGIAAFTGGMVGNPGLWMLLSHLLKGGEEGVPVWVVVQGALGYPLVLTLIGVGIAVSRVRSL